MSLVKLKLLSLFWINKCVLRCYHINILWWSYHMYDYVCYLYFLSFIFPLFLIEFCFINYFLLDSILSFILNRTNLFLFLTRYLILTLKMYRVKYVHIKWSHEKVICGAEDRRQSGPNATISFVIGENDIHKGEINACHPSYI